MRLVSDRRRDPARVPSEGCCLRTLDCSPGVLTIGSAVGACSAIGEAVAGSIERADGGEFAVHAAELAAHPLDVAVDRAVVHEYVVGVGRVHQLVAALDDAGSGSERL